MAIGAKCWEKAGGAKRGCAWLTKAVAIPGLGVLDRGARFKEDVPIVSLDSTTFILC